jgi:hypothetical protein
MNLTDRRTTAVQNFTRKTPGMRIAELRKKTAKDAATKIIAQEHVAIFR